MIFVVEDDNLLRRTVGEFLRGAGHDVEVFADAESALAAAKDAAPDLVVSDVQLPGMGGLELLAELAKVDPAIVRIAMTAHGSLRAAVGAIRSGCYEYLEKPLDLPKLARIVDRALTEQRTSRELAWSRPKAGRILGASSAIEELRRRIDELAQIRGDAPPVLLLGETGVGKGLVARELHAARMGENAPWIEVNCAAIPAALVEGELFGYERSAFTDAKQAKPGLFEAASGGTLFLDEIGDLPLDLQPKLLHVLESRSIRRLGSLRPRAIQVAIVAASNVDLEKAIAAGRFRADLYHRLAAFTIPIPPLRDRGDDAVILARAFVAAASSRYGRACSQLSSAAEARIRSHAWPGNVRELGFAMDQAILRSPRDATVVEGDLIPSARPGHAEVVPSGHVVIDARGTDIQIELPESGVDFDTLERAILAKALERAGGNITRAAKLLGKTRDWLRYRLGRSPDDG